MTDTLAIGDAVRITSDDAFDGCTGPIKEIDDSFYHVEVRTRLLGTYLVPCTRSELTKIEPAQEEKR